MNEQIKKIMQELIDADATPGINYAILNKQQYLGSLGLKAQYRLANEVLKEENNLNTIYDLASLTKVICTLTIIFRLYEKGLLNLTDKVKTYLPDFNYDDITIYDLLTHTSGLPADLNSKEIIAKEEIVQKIYSLKKVKKGQFLYSDIGYIFLGLIIEKVCIKTLDKVFAEEVTIPLEMQNTGFNPKTKNIVAPTEITKERGVIRGIVHDEKACSMKGIAGHAGVFSDIHDVVNFVSMILNKGIFKGKKYLDKSTIERWFSPLIEIDGYYRSFCWYVGNNPNIIEEETTDIISFNGFTGPSISIDRKNNIGIIMLTNRVHPTRDNRLNIVMRKDISKKVYHLLKNEITIDDIKKEPQITKSDSDNPKTLSLKYN